MKDEIRISAQAIKTLVEEWDKKIENCGQQIHAAETDIGIQQGVLKLNKQRLEHLKEQRELFGALLDAGMKESIAALFKKYPPTNAIKKKRRPRK